VVGREHDAGACSLPSSPMASVNDVDLYAGLQVVGALLSRHLQQNKPITEALAGLRHSYLAGSVRFSMENMFSVVVGLVRSVWRKLGAYPPSGLPSGYRYWALQGITRALSGLTGLKSEGR
jgi:hypothetical protein